MGRRGPAPKPTVLKLLEGNPGHQKINRQEPMPPKPRKCPSAPKDLPPLAKKEYKRLAPKMYDIGLLTEADLPAFVELCRIYAYYREIDQVINSDGIEGNWQVQTAESGYSQKHPYLTIRREYYELWTKGLAQFGMTPASRTRLMVDNPKGAKAEDDPMAAVLAGVY